MSGIVNPADLQVPVMIPPDAVVERAEPPEGPRVTRVGVRAQTEYVSGSPHLFVSRFVQSLPQYIDDITRDFGPDVYERMFRDAQCWSCLQIFKLAVLAEGLTLKPRIEDVNDPDFALSAEIHRAAEQMINGMDRPFELWLYEMLDGMAFGNKPAEQVYRVETIGPLANKLVLDRLKTKPRGTTAYVTDAFFNVIGIIGLIPGQGSPVLVGHLVADPASLPNMLPRQKFAVFTFNPQNADPRGRSIYRPAYTAWWAKMQLWGQFLQALAQFGTPSLWGTTAPDSQQLPATDSAGNALENAPTPEQDMVATLEQLRAGSVAAFPNGATVNALYPSEATRVLIDGMEFCDKQIAKAILSQTLATEEGDHMSRAAAETHADTLDIGVRHARMTVEMMIESDVLKTWVLYNWGPHAARFLTPRAKLGGTKPSDWHADATAVSSLVSCGFLSPSQYKALDDRLNLPPRTDEPQRAQPVPGGAAPSGPVQPQTPPTSQPGEPTPAVFTVKQVAKISQHDWEKAKALMRLIRGGHAKLVA